MFSPRVAAMMPLPMVFDFLAIRIDSAKADGKTLLIDWVMTDEDSTWRLSLSNAALSHAKGSHGALAQATVSMNRKLLRAIMAKGGRALDDVGTDKLPVRGDVEKVKALFECIDQFNPIFNIVEP